MLTYADALLWLEERSYLGMTPGRERIERLMGIMGDPQDSFRSIAVCGTNGKFSVATMTASILECLGLNVGVYTSPHLYEPTERIRVAGVDLSPLEFASTLKYLLPFIEMSDAQGSTKLTYFETLTAMAFETFFSRAIHAAVLECGLGGEYDATGAADAEVAVLTSIGLDHIPQFGRDPAVAALEKAGIVKPSAIFLVGELPDDLESLVVARALERGASRTATLGKDFAVMDRYPSPGGQTLSVRGLEATYEDLFLPCFGTHQANNAALAIAAVESFAQVPLSIDAIGLGLASVKLPARFEIVDRHPLVVVDTAHNPQALKSTLLTLRSELEFEKLIVVWGTLSTKPIAEMAELIASASSVVVCEPNDPRKAPAQDLVDALNDAEAKEITIATDADDAIRGARETADPSDAILIVGSFELAASARLKVSR